jgi:hypothetical protein
MAGRGQMPPGLLFDDSPRNEEVRLETMMRGEFGTACESHGGH